MHTRRAGCHGFTLTELMIVIAIAAILAMIGAPAMGKLIARTHEAGAASSIAGSLRHARTTAVMRNTRVVVCPSADGRQCLAGYDWQHGWIVARDADGDGKADADAAPFAVIAAMTPGSRIITSAGRTHVIFHPDGNAAGSNASFTICEVRERHGKSVVVSNSGRVRVATADPDHLQRCLAGLQSR